MFKRRILATIMALIAVPILLAAAGDGTWVSKVPEKDRQKQNPFDTD